MGVHVAIGWKSVEAHQLTLFVRHIKIWVSRLFDHPRPLLAAIGRVVASHFGCLADSWAEGTRSDDAGRAVAAYVARRRFGYGVREVAGALGYRSHGGVHDALLRVEGAPCLSASVERIYKKIVNDKVRSDPSFPLVSPRS